MNMQAMLKQAQNLQKKMLSEQEAIMQIDPRTLDALLHPTFDTTALKNTTPIAQALAASPGSACGKIVFTAEDAIEQGKRGESATAGAVDPDQWMDAADCGSPGLHHH